MKWLAIVGATVLLLRALLEVYWFLGGEKFYQLRVIPIPTPDGPRLVEPATPSTLSVIVAFPFLAFIMLSRVGAVNGHLGSAGFATFVLAVASFLMATRTVGDFYVRGFFKKLTTTSFARWDTYAISPTYLMLSVVCMLLSAE